jgi:KUP system potassium uptake protein
MHIFSAPWIILETLNPLNAVNFFLLDGWLAFLALGSVVLAVTGAEALYADMGHFGRRPIGLSWLWFVLPALMLNYMGQGAMIVTSDPATAAELIKNPFFFLAPDTLRLPLVIIATLAAIIASQAVISGAFSVTQQAIQLGFIPRLRITHTSERAAGQIYIPVVNWALMVMVILLVLFFQNSSNLTAAYGIAVTGAMFIDTCLLAVVLTTMWKWSRPLVVLLLGLFFVVDTAYFTANLMKVPDGGWFPLLVGAVAFTMLTTWAKGRKLMIDRMNEASLPMEIFIKSAAPSAARVPGTAVFMTSSASGVPHALLHNLKHNKVLHERIFLLTVRVEDVPYVPQEKRVEQSDYGSGFYRIVLRYGFMEEPDVPTALAQLKNCGVQCKMMDTSFFLARQTLLASSRPGMAIGHHHRRLHDRFQSRRANHWLRLCGVHDRIDRLVHARTAHRSAGARVDQHCHDLPEPVRRVALAGAAGKGGARRGSRSRGQRRHTGRDPVRRLAADSRQGSLLRQGDRHVRGRNGRLRQRPPVLRRGIRGRSGGRRRDIAPPALERRQHRR